MHKMLGCTKFWSLKLKSLKEPPNEPNESPETPKLKYFEALGPEDDSTTLVLLQPECKSRV